ncbi:hypothetical protein AAF712_005421 [Marasmius tenuissimus]|uniref:Uncharacterized protein n=1 Tax=Marasmius tenuissimus TaxID=585030 RepID=A0ABR3A1J1_9AGAR
MTMTPSFLKKQQTQKIRRKASSRNVKGIKTSDIRLLRQPKYVDEDDSCSTSTSPSPDFAQLSFQFPYPPLPTPSNHHFSPPTSPFSSPSSTSSGLPITPEASPVLSATTKAKRASVRPLTIIKRNTDQTLSFGNFFSAPLEEESEVEFEDGEVSPLDTEAFVVIPPVRSPSPASLSSSAYSDDDYYTHAIGSLLTLDSSVPQMHPASVGRRQSAFVEPMDKALPSIPENVFSPSRACFPSAQLDPAWGRRSFLIPTRAPPPPPTTPSPVSSALSPRMSVVPLDTVEEDDFDEESLFGYYAAPSSAHSPCVSTTSHSSSSSSEYDEPSELDEFDVQFEVDFDMDSELRFPVSLPGSPADAVEVLEVIEEESETETRDGDDVQPQQSYDNYEYPLENFEYDEEEKHAQYLQAPPLRSKWSSSTLSSVNNLQSPKTPSSSAVTKFRMYLRGSLSSTPLSPTFSPKKEKASMKGKSSKGKRGVVVVGPSGSSASAATSTSVPFSPGAKQTRFMIPSSPTSPSASSAWSFGSPRSPTFSDFGMQSLTAAASASSKSSKPPVPTSPKPAMYTPNNSREKHVRRKPSTSSTSSASTGISSGSSASERLRRKPIPVEMFLRA